MELGRTSYGFEICKDFYNKAKEEMLDCNPPEQLEIKIKE